MFIPIKTYCDNLIADFKNIPHSRKELLEKILPYITTKQ